MTTRPSKHPKTGVYQYRRAVPDDLRQLVGKREEKRSLGTKDPEVAKRLFAEVSREVEAKWASLREGYREISEREAHVLAKPVYDRWLILHRDNPGWQLHWHPEHFEALWTAESYDPDSSYPDGIPIDEFFFRTMRRMCYNEADALIEIHGLLVDSWGRWTIAKAVGAAFQRASLLLKQYSNGIDVGDFQNVSQQGPGLQATESGKSIRVAFTFGMMLEEWKRERQPRPRTIYQAERMIKKLENHLGYNDVNRLNSDDIISWKNSLRDSNLSAKTIRDGRLGILRAMLAVAVQNRRIDRNVADGITIKVKLELETSPRGFSDAEAIKILTAARQAPDSVRHWIPLLCAYSGARVGEICHLRVEDVRNIDGIATISFNPGAGPLKNRRAIRTIPLHPVVLEAGFLKFVAGRQNGPLFPELLLDRFGSRSLNGTKTIGRWIRKLGITDEQISPSHSWRHRFRSIARINGLAVDIVDAILGHSRATIGDRYGDYTPEAMLNELIKIPRIPIS